MLSTVCSLFLHMLDLRHTVAGLGLFRGCIHEKTSSWSGFSVCSSDPRSLRFAQAGTIAAGDAHVAVELTVDATATLDIVDPRALSTRDEPRLAANDFWASK